MKRIKRALKYCLPYESLKRKFPRETAPLFTKSVLDPGGISEQDIISFNKLFNFDDLWIFHGISIKKHDRAIVLSGPPGIGKSTLLQKIARTHIAEPMDDWFIIIGRAKGCYYVLESGLYPTMRTILLLNTGLRTLFRYKSPYLNTDNHHARVKTTRREKIRQQLAALIGSYAARDRRTERVLPSQVRLATLFLVIHPHYSCPTLRLSGGTIKHPDACEIEGVFNHYARCEVIHAYDRDLRNTLQNRILNELGNFTPNVEKEPNHQEHCPK